MSMVCSYHLIEMFCRWIQLENCIISQSLIQRHYQIANAGFAVFLFRYGLIHNYDEKMIEDIFLVVGMGMVRGDRYVIEAFSEFENRRNALVVMF